MTAQIIDFGEAKARILGKGTKDETATVTPALSNALEAFSFSRLSKLERIQRVLSVALSADCNSDFNTLTLNAAAYLESQLPDTVFLKPPTKR